MAYFYNKKICHTKISVKKLRTNKYYIYICTEKNIKSHAKKICCYKLQRIQGAFGVESI